MNLKFIPTTNRFPEVTAGVLYEIVGLDEDGDAYFIDDCGEQNFSMAHPECDLRSGGEWYAV